MANFHWEFSNYPDRHLLAVSYHPEDKILGYVDIYPTKYYATLYDNVVDMKIFDTLHEAVKYIEDYWER